MLQVSRRAWHFRLVRFFSEYYTPRNLCGYFWNIVGTLLLSLLLVLSLPLWPIGVVVSRGMSILLYTGKSDGQREEFGWSFRGKGARHGVWWSFGFSMILWLALGLYILGRVLAWEDPMVWVVLLILVCLFAGFLGCVGLLPAPKPYPAHHRDTKREDRPKQPNLLVEFLKAKKQMVCPLLTVVD